MNIEKQQVLGLAGALQSLSLVNSVATTGSCDRDIEYPLMCSLLSYNPDQVIDAYGKDIFNLSHGLRTLIQLFSNANNSQREFATYLLNAINIELKIIRTPRLLSIIQNDLHSIRESYHSDDHEDKSSHDMNDLSHSFSQEIIEDFAKIYKKTASTVEPRIMIRGEGSHLQVEENATKIRALLLSTLRGIGFYRQYGGTRLGFMIKRKNIIDIANNLLKG